MSRWRSPRRSSPPRNGRRRSAAQTRLVKALRAVELAAGKADDRQRGARHGKREAALAAEASNAKTVISIGRVGYALGALAIIAGIAWAGIKSFQDEVARSGELDKFAEGLRLTDAQIEKAGGKVKYLADGTREITGLTVSWGNIAQATWQVVAERAGISSKSISDGFTRRSHGSATSASSRSPSCSAFAGAHRADDQRQPQSRQAQHGAVRQADQSADRYEEAFFKTFDEVNAGFDKIGQRSKDLAKAQLQAESDATSRRRGEEAEEAERPRPRRSARRAGRADQRAAEARRGLPGQRREAIKAEAQQKAEEQAIRHKATSRCSTRRSSRSRSPARRGRREADRPALGADGGSEGGQRRGRGRHDRRLASIEEMQDEAQLRPCARSIAGEKAATAEGKAKDWLGCKAADARDRPAPGGAGQVERRGQPGPGIWPRRRMRRTRSPGSSSKRRSSARPTRARQVDRAPRGRAVPEAITPARRGRLARLRHGAGSHPGVYQEPSCRSRADRRQQTAQDNYNKSLSYTADLMA
jgi:hypothetical protein